MEFLDQITVLILTYNEEANIGRTLDALGWATNILVVDSGSSDATLAIVRRHSQTRVLTRPFDSFASQCNFGLANITSRWVLSLDADYEVSQALAAEIAVLSPDAAAGYRASFVYRVYGHPLRGTLYPPRTVLYRRDRARYEDEGHGHRVVVDGAIRSLQGPIFHDDRKPLARWFSSQQSYATREADHLLSVPRAQLGRNDRIRLKAWPAPILVFAYALIVKGCFLHGWPGWLYVMQRTLAEIMIALELVDRRLRPATSSLPPAPGAR
jgi:glycosyltransferase involved in cell wall biosynthesis